MSLIVTSDMIGEKVTFQSKNSNDPITYTGTISALITYALAPSFGADTLAYTASVQRIDPTVGDATTLNYFVISLAIPGSTAPVNRVFADEWIAVGSFSVIQQTKIYNLNVYDLPNNGAQAMLSILRANGYNAVVVTNIAQASAALATTS